MKKLVLTAVATLGLALGAFAQGTFNLDNGNVGGWLNIQATVGGPIDVYSGPVTFSVYANASGSTLGTLVNEDYNSLTSKGYFFEMSASTTADGGLFNAGKIDLNHIVAHSTSASVVVVAAVGNYAGLQEFRITDLGDFSPLTGTPTTPGSIANMGDLTMTLQVPEPSTVALGVMGLSALLFRRRK